jgi:hypothetical protein
MDLDDFSIAVFCLSEEAVPQVMAGRRLRQRGPAPTPRRPRADPGRPRGADTGSSR